MFCKQGLDFKNVNYVYPAAPFLKFQQFYLLSFHKYQKKQALISLDKSNLNSSMRPVPKTPV